MSEVLSLHRPSLVKQRLEELKVRQIVPSDITDKLDILYGLCPDLAGDRGAIGVSDSDGHCQSWWGDWGWWKRLPGMPQE